MNVKFPSTNFNMMYQGDYLKSNKNIGFKSNNGIIYEDDYVKIPRKKYERDKFLKYIEWGVVGSYILYLLIKAFTDKGRPPFP